MSVHTIYIWEEIRMCWMTRFRYILIKAFNKYYRNISYTSWALKLVLGDTALQTTPANGKLYRLRQKISKAKNTLTRVLFNITYRMIIKHWTPLMYYWARILDKRSTNSWTKWPITARTSSQCITVSRNVEISFWQPWSKSRSLPHNGRSNNSEVFCFSDTSNTVLAQVCAPTLSSYRIQVLCTTQSWR